MKIVIVIIMLLTIFQEVKAENKISLYTVYKGGKWGFVDKTGKLVIDYRFDGAEDFSEDIALVQVKKKFGFILANGKWLHKPVFHNALDFSNGMGAVEINGKWGFVNKKGILIIKPQFSLPKSGSDEFGFPPPVRSFSDGLAVVNKLGLAYYIDKFGRVAIPNKILDKLNVSGIDSFSEGLAPVEINKKWGFIDKKGSLIIDAKFDAVGNDGIFGKNGFWNGLAAVKIREQWGYINRKGVFVIEPQFDFAGFSTENLLGVEKDGLYGFIDTTGKYIIEPKFDLVRPFCGNLTTVMKEGKWGVINKLGVYILEPKFPYLDDCKNGAIRFTENGLTNFMDYGGKIFLAIKE